MWFGMSDGTEVDDDTRDYGGDDKQASDVVCLNRKQASKSANSLCTSMVLWCGSFR